MITSAEIRRIAGLLQVDPMIIEKDYVLGCYLHFLAHNPDVIQNWIFKGGTCLKKCYFKEYRFSEDLDFTLRRMISKDDLGKIINSVNDKIQNEIGIRFDASEPLIETIEDEYGKESYEARVYYRGPWIFRGSSPALRIHLNRDEIILFPVKELSINHSYSDQKDLPEIQIISYSIEEILAEKLRAFSGQRRFAIARDIFDIYQLINKGVEIDSVLNAFPEKCKIKGILPTDIDFDSIRNRKDEFLLNWENNLEYLVPEDLQISFDEAWTKSIKWLKLAVDNYK